SLSTSQPSTASYPRSLHDALPIYQVPAAGLGLQVEGQATVGEHVVVAARARELPPRPAGAVLEHGQVGDGDGEEVPPADVDLERSEEHTSELQSRENLVCRLLLEK